MNIPNFNQICYCYFKQSFQKSARDSETDTNRFWRFLHIKFEYSIKSTSTIQQGMRTLVIIGRIAQHKTSSIFSRSNVESNFFSLYLRYNKSAFTNLNSSSMDNFLVSYEYALFDELAKKSEEKESCAKKIFLIFLEISRVQ